MVEVSNFTDDEWANIKRMLNGMLENKALAVEILRNGLKDNEADIYRAYFLLTEHRIQCPTEGMKKVEVVNYYWTLTEDLKQKILKMRPWLDVNEPRTKHVAPAHGLAELEQCLPGDRHLYIPKARPARKTPLRKATPVATRKRPVHANVGRVDTEDVKGQHNKRAGRS